MAENTHLVYVAASYGFTFAVLAIVAVSSLMRWKRAEKKLKEAELAKEA